jgi:effector-binding domain-containing protein
MSNEESEQIFNTIKRKKTNNNDNPREYKLSGIFYINKDNWTVWINNVPYSSIGQKNDFSIDEVTEEIVILTMPDGITIEISVDSSCEKQDDP